ncbi:hypothetical protein NPX13_g6876 [Xylaria arbuscula]|uniref:NACHT domain-containing protein n=1 Tax=Xylaria arbuscula TaxID=114810 RepID=A0A9W8NBQ3_9PEZI|nr:hypothetical protein NPX13_g6876 [Xylaria arbuscula]
MNKLTTKSSAPSRVRSGVRLDQVYPPTNKHIDTEVDIIAIHGLDTHSPQTWEWKTPGSREPPVNWLSHEKLLPKRVPSARIFTCDWPSDLFESSEFTQKRFEEFARLLLAGIDARPSAPTSSKHKERPILFIASCLGGVILMKALVMASREYIAIRNATRGIVFLSTPFDGTSFRDVAAWADPGLKALALISNKKVSNLLNQTKPSFDLQELCSNFTAICHDEIEPECIAAFYELGKTSLLRKVAPWLPDFLAQLKPLVDERSGTLQIIRSPVPLHRRHVEMNKFPLPCCYRHNHDHDPECNPGCSHKCDTQCENIDYQLISGRIQAIFAKICEGRPIEKADEHILKACYKDENLQVVRITGESLPMERCYINLVIVEHSANKSMRDQARASQSSFLPLHKRLKIETPCEDIRIDMQHLFDPRKGHDGKIVRPRRILIRSQAGVGKSTLCKKIVHDFIHHSRWHNMFNRILWIPLRNLKILDKANCNLKAMFRQEYFANVSKGEELAEELWTELEADKFENTVFILDGLDEVYEGLDRGHYMFNLLDTLLNFPTVIVTSRPHVSFGRREFDLELETIGFYPDQVQSYIRSVITVRGEKEEYHPDQQKIQGLESLLEKHPLLQGLVRIPIQLDALCYIWSSDNDGGNSNGLLNAPTLTTMTGIYQVIVERLWKKDIVRLEKDNGKRTLVQRDVDNLPLRHAENYVREERDFLEKLAFTGMLGDVINFPPFYLAEIFSDEDSRFLFETTLSKLSFIRTSNPSSKNPTYHFLHLTFQEYFAARYFVRQWKAGKPLLHGKGELATVDTFFMYYKYDARYDIFWRFVTGILCLQGEEMRRLSHLIEGEPRDLVGPVHQRFVMHCLSEVPLEQEYFAAIRKRLEQQLGSWATFECNFLGESRLPRNIEFPENLLEKILLESVTTLERTTLIDSLTHRPNISARVMRLISSWLQDDVRWGVNSTILHGFVQEHHGELDNEVPQAIVMLLGDKSKQIQVSAIQILHYWSPLKNDILGAVVRQAMEGEGPVQLTAINLLGEQPQLDNQVVDGLIALLERITYLEDLILINEQRSIDCRKVHRIVERRSTGTLFDLQKVIIDALVDQKQTRGQLPFSALSMLRSSNFEYRRVAIRILENWANSFGDNIDVIAELLDDKEFPFRFEIIKDLYRISKPKNKILYIVRAELENQNPQVRHQCITALRTLRELDHEIIEAVATRLGDEVDHVRWEAGQLLSGRRQLSDGVLDAIKVRLQDRSEHDDIRRTAIETLTRQSQPSDDILEVIKARALDTSEHPDVRATAIGILISRGTRIINDIHDMIIVWLQDKDTSIRSVVLDALKSWPQPGDRIVEEVVAQIKQNSEFISKKALSVLEKWPQLGDTNIDAIITLLSTTQPRSLRSLAANVVRNQPQPKRSVVEILVKQLNDSKFYNGVSHKYSILCALANWTQLDDTALSVATKKLADWGGDVLGDKIRELFRNQKARPGNEIINAIGKIIDREYPDGARQAALKIMGGIPDLSDEWLVTIAADYIRDGFTPLSSSTVINLLAFDVLRAQAILPFECLKPYMKLVYKHLLWKSRDEHVYWLTEKEQSFIVFGARRVEWKLTSNSTGSGDHNQWLHHHIPMWLEEFRVSSQASEPTSSLWPD